MDNHIKRPNLCSNAVVYFSTPHSGWQGRTGPQLATIVLNLRKNRYFY